mmetsp:Transcript_117/g.448  ORF Transcript_117/g.448 Transcript_117/m.448 type:complete len:106 (-) Transcript_117:454-771(-)
MLLYSVFFLQLLGLPQVASRRSKDPRWTRQEEDGDDEFSYQTRLAYCLLSVGWRQRSADDFQSSSSAHSSPSTPAFSSSRPSWASSPSTPISLSSASISCFISST